MATVLKCKQDADHWTKKIEFISNDYEKRFNDLVEYRTMVEKNIEKALELGDRIHTDKSVEEIDTQIKKLTAILKEQARVYQIP
jgi:hypothetical protein